MVMCAAEEVAQRRRKKNTGVASQECRIAIVIEFDEIETTECFMKECEISVCLVRALEVCARPIISTP